jgi:hypothetical protein
MKAFHALVLSLVAGISTFSAEHFFFPATLHAAAFPVPQAANWRQQMIDSDPGGAIVEQMLAHQTDKLALTPAQVARFRPVLERQHEEILSVLLTGPASLTRDQFLAARAAIRNNTRRRLDALLTPDQLEIAHDTLKPASA